MGAWSVYVACSLCSARTRHHSDDDVTIADAAAWAEASALGYVPLPDVTGERRRIGAVLCPGCVADVQRATGIVTGGT
jgi:hypothetical protein